MKQSPDCGHVYHGSSAGEPGDRYTVTALTRTGSSSGQGAGQSGTSSGWTDLRRSVQIAVGEAQVLVQLASGATGEAMGMTNTATRADTTVNGEANLAAPPLVPPPKLRRRPAIVAGAVGAVCLGRGPRGLGVVFDHEHPAGAGGPGRDPARHGDRSRGPDAARINVDPAVALPASSGRRGRRPARGPRRRGWRPAAPDVVQKDPNSCRRTGSRSSGRADARAGSGRAAEGWRPGPGRGHPGAGRRGPQQRRRSARPRSSAPPRRRDRPDWSSTCSCPMRRQPSWRRGWRPERRPGPRFEGPLMAVIALTSASGSPGVTTTTPGPGDVWPRPVLLVEADPTGGSGILAGFFRGTREYDGGLIELALWSATTSPTRCSRGPALRGHPGVVLAGTRSHHQAGRAARPLGAPGRGVGRPGVDRPGRHRRCGPPRAWSARPSLCSAGPTSRCC